MKNLFQKIYSPAAAMVLAFAIGISCVVLVVARPDYFDPDTAQYVDTARHILRGEGFSSSLIYYEQQMAAGTIPVPQTVWPPGYPAVVAIAMAAGIPAVFAPIVIALLSHSLASLVLFSVLRHIGCKPVVAASGAIAYCATVLASVLVLRGLSESTYVLLTLLCTLGMALPVDETKKRRKILLFAGGAAAGAFLTRYAGITFVASLGLVVGIGFLAERSLKSWWDALTAMSLPLGVVAAVFGRNYLLAGTVTGGPSVESGTPLPAVIRAMFWSFEQMLGIVNETARPLLFIMVVVALLLAFQMMRGFRVSALRLMPLTPVASMILLSSAYILSNFVMYGYIAHKRFPELIHSRYLLPLLPFLIIIFCASVTYLQRLLAQQAGRRMAVNAISAAVLVAFLAAQIQAVGFWKDWLNGDQRFSLVLHALQEPVGKRTVREVIASHAGNGSLLAVDGQLLGMWLDMPTVGLTGTTWSSRVWTTEEVHELVRKFDVRVICAFPLTFESGAAINRNRRFFIDLDAGLLPPWLRLVASTPSAKIYEVIPGA